MWNTSFSEHTSKGKCDKPHFTIRQEVKYGLGWKQSLACINCDYVSKLYRLYCEVASDTRGARSATCNVGLQVGLQDSPIGNSKARMLIASTNTPPPALSSMTRLSNKVGAATVTLNNEDMARRKQSLKDVNVSRGLPVDEPVNISVDVRYNSSLIASNHKMGQNASQAIGVMVEQHTDDKQIIGFHLQNKLCWVGSYLRNKGFDVQCPGHPDCTANIQKEEPLSEYKIGEKLGEDLVNNDLLVHYVVTDGDARSAEGIKQEINETNPNCRVERQADTIHLGQSVFRHTVRANFSEGMFPGMTAERRKEQQKMLGLDLRTRCHAIISRLYKNYAGNMDHIEKKMPAIIETTLHCYGGDCSRCRYSGVVCGGGKKNNWWRRSPYLWNWGLKELTVNDNDRNILRALINLRLGIEALRLTKLNLNTNKNESINRALSVSLPKNVNFSRNANARASATVHRLNYGAGDSLIKKLEYLGSPVTRGRYVSTAIKQFQEKSRYHINYMKKNMIRRRKMYNKIRQIRAYLRAKYTKRIKPDYIKGQLDPKYENPFATNIPLKHDYPLRERARNKHDHSYVKPLHHI